MADIVNGMLQGLVDFVNGTVGRIPDLCPLKEGIETAVASFDSEMLGYVNYFLPVSEFVAVLAGWVAVITGYYAVSIVLRWIKAIS